MNSTANPAVVIPVYKVDLNRYERISLQRHLSVLHRFDRYLLVPSSLRASIEKKSIVFPSVVAKMFYQEIA